MGKTKVNRRKHKGECPTGVINVQDNEKQDLGESGPNAACPSDSAIQHIIDQLQGSVEDKVFALHSLATIFQRNGAVEDILQQKVVRIAGPLLLDASSAVRNAAAGALRNLSSSGSHEICDLLIQQDIMTPVSSFFLKCTDEWNFSGITKSEESDTFAQTVYLLWNLCEGNSTAVQYFNERNLVTVLMKYISAAPENLNITLAIVHCLITVVEDNSSACTSLLKSEEVLHSLLTTKGDGTNFLLLRVLTAGILLKIKNYQQNMLTPILLEAIISPLIKDQRKILNDLTSIEPNELAENQGSLQEVNYLLEAQQVSLELLTNLCADGDDPDVDTNSMSSEDGRSSLEDFESVPSSADVDLPASSVLPEVHDVIVSQNLMKKIWEKTRPPAENVCSLLHEHSGGEHLLKRVDVLRERAFLCLNNLIPALDVQDFGGQQKVFEMWCEMAANVFTNPEPNPEILEAESAAMRAVLEKFTQTVRENPIEIQLSEIEFIFSSAPNPNSSVRASVLKTVCMLGMATLCQQSKQNLQVLKNAGKFLLDACGHEVELWVLAEAIDCIMDLFGEDETDQVSMELGLIDHLQTLLPNFRRKVHVNRKKLGDHHALVSTVNTNLPRFIHYKMKRLSLLRTSV